jgi:hypothetical protein
VSGPTLRCTACLGKAVKLADAHDPPCGSTFYLRVCPACNGVGTREAQNDVTLREMTTAVLKYAVWYREACMIPNPPAGTVRDAKSDLFEAIEEYLREKEKLNR